MDCRTKSTIYWRHNMSIGAREPQPADASWVNKITNGNASRRYNDQGRAINHQAQMPCKLQPSLLENENHRIDTRYHGNGIYTFIKAQWGTVYLSLQGNFAGSKHQDHTCCNEQEMKELCLTMWLCGVHGTTVAAAEDKQLTMFHMLYCWQRLLRSMSHCWCCTL